MNFVKTVEKDCSGPKKKITLSFGQYLRILRTERKLNCAQVALLCKGTPDRHYVFRLEKGERVNPSEGIIHSLTKGLSLSNREMILFIHLAVDKCIFNALAALFLDEDFCVTEGELMALSHLCFQNWHPITKSDWNRVLINLRGIL